MSSSTEDLFDALDDNPKPRNRRGPDAPEQHTFNRFFAGLTFFILVSSALIPIESNLFIINLVEVESWVILTFTGLIALWQAGGFSVQRAKTPSNAMRITMWVLFIAGIALFLGARIAELLLNN